MVVGRVVARVLAVISCASALSSCAPPERVERIEMVESAIIGGRASGDDENATVVVALLEEDGRVTSRCSGRIVAPTLALTARHCILRTEPGTSCSADGSPKDLATAGDMTAAASERIVVQVGSQRVALRNVAVRAVHTTTALSICKADLAFLVLDEVAFDVHTPIRRAPVRVGEVIAVSGWGQTSEGSTAPTAGRSTLDAVRVKEIGPGLVPTGSFAVGGASLCYGDSGAAAVIDGAIVGAYSRIDGNCETQSTTNVFSGLSTELELVERAFAAIGEKPLYADPPPVIAADASADGADAGAPSPEPRSDDGCSNAPRSRSHPGHGGALLTIAFLVWRARRARQRPCLRINL